MTSDPALPTRTPTASASPTLSAEGDVICINIPAQYAAAYGAFVRFLRGQLPGVWIDWVAVKEAYRFGRDRAFPVARRRQESAPDEKAKVRISADGLAAYLVLFPPKPQGKRLTEPDLLRLITAYGVPAHLLETQQVRLAFLRRSYLEPERIAAGNPPVDGSAARIAWVRGLPSDPEGFIPAVTEGEATYPTAVLAAASAGQIVGTLYPPGEGIPGVSVAGAAIPPKRGDNPTRLGDGLELLADGASIRASRSGQLRIAGKGGTNGRIFPLLVARGPQDLEPWAGGVFPGSVVVEGDLELRFPLCILGDVEVQGGLVRSGLEVLGSLFVRDGVINHGRVPVRVGGVLSAAFLDRASVMADTVHLRRYSLQSKIVASRAVYALGTGVSVAGGQVHAQHRIDASALGSPNSMETEAAVGLPATATAFQTLYQSWADALAQAAAPDEAVAEELKAAAEHWQKAAHGLSASDPTAARIRAQKVHAGVGIRIAGALREIGNTCGPVAFAYEKIGERDRVAMIRQ